MLLLGVNWVAQKSYFSSLILNLLTTNFPRNCSNVYMQDDLVSESVTSELYFSDLAIGFCLASYKSPFIHLYLSQSPLPENHMAA